MDTPKKLMQHIIHAISGLYDEQEAKSIAFELLERELEVSRTQVLLNDCLPKYNQNHIKQCIKRLQQGEPIQYITGVADFYDSTFTVNTDVLIPRSETEELVDLIIRDHPAEKPLKILDIGTGSACIPITLKKHLPKADVYTIDISEKALAVAEENAKKHKVEIHFYALDVLNDDLSSLPNMDVLVSNPPYVRDLEKEFMHANVLNFEPHLALFVPDTNPLIFYHRIAELAKSKLNSAGKLYFEINEAFGKECQTFVTELGFRNVEIFKDMQMKDRILRAIKH